MLIKSFKFLKLLSKLLSNIILINILFISLCFAEDISPIKPNSFENLIENIKTLEASFKQYKLNKNKEQFESSGKLYIVKPEKFRWDILNPNSQTLVSDGVNFIDYDIDLEQATRKKLTENDKTAPIYILSGSYEGIAKDYDVVTAKTINNMVTYSLIPKKPMQFAKQGHISGIDISFNKGLITEIALSSNKKLVTKIKLSNVKLNGHISNSKFNLIIPKNVEILK